MAVSCSLCVYCGSKAGADPGYGRLAESLGRRCAREGVRVIYGGGRVGMMGRLAEAALEAGGEVVGIIPEHLKRAEVSYEDVTELLVVGSLHARKQAMADRSDAFCVLPGGIGTLDETIEIVTWKQLGLHEKPIFLLNHEGYWDPLLALFDWQRQAGFLGSPDRELFRTVADADALFRALAELDLLSPR